MKFSYFPGCSLKGTGRSYEESLLAICRVIGIELVELEDWNCCGATAYMSVDERKAFVLASRNLALAEQVGRHQLMAPCSACYLVLNKTQRYIQDSPEIANTVHRALKAADLQLTTDVKVRHPLDVFVNDVGLDAIKRLVKHPLKGLKVAPYYGCQIVRPYSTFDAQHNPTTLDRLLEAVGAEVVHYPLKTKCCGGSLTGTLPQAGLGLVHVLLSEALRRKANVIATVCPLCQFNLDAYHDQVEKQWGPARIPTVYFTQLLGLAFGLSPEVLGLNRHFVPMQPTTAPATA